MRRPPADLENGATAGEGEDPPAEEFWWLLMEVANLSRRLSERRLARIHTTPDQIHALHIITLREQMTVGELAAALGLEQNSGSQLVERLVQRGLVKRDRAPEDRRQSLITVSDEGRALLLAGEPDAELLMEELCSELPPEQIRQSAGLLRRMRANANRTAASRPPRSDRRAVPGRRRRA
ncbi:MAG TPA: MarR family transcriptional regulator [Dehalococcoidia bacterium]|nr:MarR family transcriptional regulator [Dehalococcoidia bacterium]